MSSKSLLFVMLLAALLLTAFAIVYFRERYSTSLPDFVPENATLVAFFPSASKAYDRFNQTSFKKALEQSSYFKDVFSDFALLDTLVHTANVTVQLKDADVAFVLTENRNNLQFVFLAEVGKRFSYWDVHEKGLAAYGSRFELVRRKTSGHNAFLLIDKQTNRQINYAFINGIFVASFNREAFEMALSPPKKQSKNALKSLIAQYDRQSSDAVLLMDAGKLLHRFARLFVPEWQNGMLKVAGQLDGWIVLNIHLRANELLLDALIDLHPLLEQVYPANILVADSLIRWLPVGTAAFTAKFVKMPTNGIDVSGHAILHGRTRPFKIFVPDSAAAFATSLFADRSILDSPLNLQWCAPIDVTEAYTILFPTGARIDTEKIFVTSNSHVFFFSPDLQLLSHYLSTQKKHLVDRDLEALSQFVSARSGMMLYQQLGKAMGWISDFSSNELRFRLLRNAAAFRGFSSVSVQLSKAGAKYYASIMLKGNAQPVGQAIPLWEANLASPINGPPFMFADGKEGRVVVFDSAGWMYGFSAEGRELWKRKLGGLPIDRPQVIVHPGKNKPYFLLNTPGAVFLTDSDGNQAPGFPLQLSSRATAGLAYDANAGQIFYVNCADRRTYAYTLTGRPYVSWDPPVLTDISVVPPTIAASAGQLYLLISSIDNKIKIVDGYGMERIKPREEPRNAPNADYFANRTNARGLFLTSGLKGEIIYVGNAGVATAPGFDLFSQEHHFHYADFDSDFSPDFLFADKQRVAVFDRFGRLIVEGRLSQPVVKKPFFLSKSGQTSAWCFDFAPMAQAAVLTPSKGLLMYDGLPKAHSYGFGYLRADGPLMMGAVTGRKLMLFQLE